MSQNKIQVGDKVPLFTLKDQNGKDFSIEERIGKKILIIYFYPKDDTPGCTREACGFRDQLEDFSTADAEVIGISSDGVGSHKKFSEKYQLPFTLLADTAKHVSKLFGVPTSMFGLLPGRVTYVVDKNGRVQAVFKGIGAKKHVEKSLKFLKEKK